MTINTRSWHYRLYVFMLQWCKAWNGHDDYYYEPRLKNIGLCSYMRMILLWGPLVILTNVVPLGMTIAALFLFPIAANGFVGVAWLLGIILLPFVLMYAWIRLTSWLENRYPDAPTKNQNDGEIKTGNIHDQEKVEPSTGFMSLLWSYLVSFKTKICPVLEVEK